MWYGRMGVDLEIDLSQGKIEKKEGNPEWMRDYFGGLGINAKLAWDRLTPEIGAFSSDNLLIFGTGVLTGTPVPAANRTIVTAISPMWNYFTTSSFGGHWGAELKSAGYDTIIFRGKSPVPVYLWINNDQLELRDATHLRGKDVFETELILRGELGTVGKEVEIVAIGPAGENKVFGASIEHGYAGSASRGVGPIMGDKNLKAIVVYGNKDINIAKPAELSVAVNEIIKRSDKLYYWMKNWPHTFTKFVEAEFHTGDKVDKELRKNALSMGWNWTREEIDFRKKYQTRSVGCHNCVVSCRARLELPDEKHPVYVKCATLNYFQTLLKTDQLTAMKFYRAVEGYGLDTFAVEQALQFAVNCYQKGIFTKEDTDGLHLEFSYEPLRKLLDKIVYREGIGDVLADGVVRAAEQIGKGSEEFAGHVIKKKEHFNCDLYFPLFAFQAAVNYRADLTRGVNCYQWIGLLDLKDYEGKDFEEIYPGYKKEDLGTEYAPYPKQSRQKMIDQGYFPFPKEFNDWFLDDARLMDVTVEREEDIAKVTNWTEYIMTMTDLTGICHFHTGFMFYPPISAPGETGVGVMARLVSYVTGLDIDETEALKTCRRVETLIRSFNVRAGLTRNEDSVPEKYFKEKPEDPLYQPLDKEKWNKIIDIFYDLKGYKKNGIPTRETLDELGLGYVKEELMKRGIL